MLDVKHYCHLKLCVSNFRATIYSSLAVANTLAEPAAKSACDIGFPISLAHRGGGGFPGQASSLGLCHQQQLDTSVSTHSPKAETCEAS